MKKNNNIKQLKEIVNNDLFFDLNYQGVQAYNISSENEYEVIIGFRKCNGRYYFIDRNRNKYLASRYDRADFIAGEMLEQKAREDETVAEAIEDIEKTGKTKILVDLAWEYIKACEARGIDPGELVDSEADNAGNVYMIHCIESGSVLVLTVGLDFMAFVAINTMAVLSRFFPSEFEKAQKPHFTKPFCFWYRLISESL